MHSVPRDVTLPSLDTTEHDIEQGAAHANSCISTCLSLSHSLSSLSLLLLVVTQNILT